MKSTDQITISKLSHVFPADTVYRCYGADIIGYSKAEGICILIYDGLYVEPNGGYLVLMHRSKPNVTLAKFQMQYYSNIIGDGIFENRLSFTDENFSKTCAVIKTAWLKINM